MAEIPVIYQGTPEGRRLSAELSYPGGDVPDRYVWVGKWTSQSVDGGGGLGSQAMGILIQGWANHRPVFHRCLHASATVFEPNSRNKLGEMGAYRELPPTQETIDAAIAKALKVVRTSMNDS